MITIRYAKVASVAAIALFATMVAFGNITDYGSNFEFVRHVLLMDSIFADSSIHVRAVEATWMHHSAYIMIIAVEVMVGLLCWLGAWRMLRQVGSTDSNFNRAKSMAIIGLMLGFMLWFVGFMTIGGEWFGMWMSHQFNGVPSAFRFIVVIQLTLIFLVMPDAIIEDRSPR